jgi:hypothetical protein
MKPTTVREVYEVLGGTTAVACQLGVNQSVTGSHAVRNGIPPQYWAQIISFAKRRRHKEITAQLLAEIHDPRRQS